MLWPIVPGAVVAFFGTVLVYIVNRRQARVAERTFARDELVAALTAQRSQIDDLRADLTKQDMECARKMAEQAAHFDEELGHLRGEVAFLKSSTLMSMADALGPLLAESINRHLDR